MTGDLQEGGIPMLRIASEHGQHAKDAGQWTPLERYLSFDDYARSLDLSTPAEPERRQA